MDVQYHCTNKIYIGESIQAHDEDLSVGQALVTMDEGWNLWRRPGSCRELQGFQGVSEDSKRRGQGLMVCERGPPNESKGDVKE